MGTAAITHGAPLRRSLARTSCHLGRQLVVNHPSSQVGSSRDILLNLTDVGAASFIRRASSHNPASWRTGGCHAFC